MNTRDHQISASALTATHPIYDLCLPDWVRALDLYEGRNLERYLHKHERESTKSFNSRKKRIIYRNFCAPVVDLYLHYLFSKPIARTSSRRAYEQQRRDIEEQRQERTEQRKRGEAVSPIRVASVTSAGVAREWEDGLKNVDRRGTPIGRFMVDAARAALTFGHSFILVDMPSVKSSPGNEYERKKRNLRPYFSLYFPTEVTNWGLNEDWGIEWIRFREVSPNSGGPFDTREVGYGEPQVATYADQDPTRPSRARTRMQGAVQYRTFTRQGWYVHEVHGSTVRLVNQGEHSLGIVPVVPLYNRRATHYPFIGVSLLSDIARLNIEILNLDSLIQEGVYQQTLNILTMSRQQGNQKEVVLSEDNVLEYTGNPPFFMSPSTAPVAFMEERIRSVREEISRIAKLGGGLGLEPRGAMSGIALAYEFNETNSVLAEKADEIESAETLSHDYWFRWMGSPWAGLVDYPNEFSVQSFQEEIDLVTKTGDAVRSPTARRELEKRALRKVLHNVSEDIREQIEFETDFIPEITKTFSGPIFFDPVRQQTNAPGGGTPVGALGDLTRMAPAKGDGDDEEGGQGGDVQPDPEDEAA